MDTFNRRRFMGAAATGAAVGLAGCVDDVLGGSSGSDYDGWLAADLIEDIEDGGVIHVDVQEVAANWPAEAQEEFDIDEMSTELGIDERNLDGMVIIEEGRGMGASEQVVLTGSFDPDEIIEGLGIPEDFIDDDAEYEGYQILMGEFAVGDDAIILSSEYETLIDAHNGEAELITDVDEEWESALDNVAGAGISGVALESDEDAELMGFAMDVSNGDVAVTIYGHFEDEAAAEDGRDEIEAEAEEDFVDEEGEIESIEVDGNVVILEATIYDFEW